MTNQIHVSSPPIEPIYSQTGPNQTIDLGQVVVQFEYQGTAHQAIANVTMRFQPDDGLRFVVPLEGAAQSFGWGIGDSCPYIKLTLVDSGVMFDAFYAGDDGDHGGTVFLPRKSAITVTARSNAISTVTFHLFNFPKFSGPEDYILATGKPSLQGAKACGRVVLKAYGWKITFAATDRTDTIEKSLEAQGGYALTHMGQIVREDGSTFASEQLDDLLECLAYFLSFAFGCWTGVALPVGFDTEGKRVFEQWGISKTAAGAWSGARSWFDIQHGEFLSQVFPGFMSLWKNELWQKPLTYAIYWYLGACDRGVGIGVDTGLILAQTALELLAWTHCVQDRKMVSPAAFKQRGLSAADKLRLLASSLGIPKEIPPSLSALSALHGKPAKKWEDGMDAITSIRNSLVHSDTQTELPDTSYVEAWRLSLWYIDMVLLRLCGYRGYYAKRLAAIRWEGGVELVPWWAGGIELVPWAEKK